MAAAGLHLPLPLRPLQLASALSWTGLLRVLAPEGPEADYGPTSFAGMLGELEALDPSLAQAGAFRQLDTRPLYVLSSGKIEPQFLEQTKLTAEQGAQFLALKRSMNQEQASWSSQSRHEVVVDSGHGIQWEQPERVLSATRWVIDAVRADQAR